MVIPVRVEFFGVWKQHNKEGEGGDGVVAESRGEGDESEPGSKKVFPPLVSYIYKNLKEIDSSLIKSFISFLNHSRQIG